MYVIYDIMMCHLTYLITELAFVRACTDDAKPFRGKEGLDERIHLLLGIPATCLGCELLCSTAVDFLVHLITQHTDHSIHRIDHTHKRYRGL